MAIVLMVQHTDDVRKHEKQPMSCRWISVSRQKHTQLWGLVPVIVLAVLSSAVRAASDLDTEMGELAKQVAGVVKDRGNSVQVGDFVAKGNAARQGATGGTAIAKSLVDQLGKSGVNVSRTAELLVSGDFRDVTDKDSNTTALQIKGKIEDRRGETVVELHSRGLFNLATIAALVGITTVTPPAASREKVEKRLDDALDKIQRPQLSGTRITPVQDGTTLPYSIEILVSPDPGQGKLDLTTYVPRAATIDQKQDGLAFLTIRRGEVYAVKVNNDSKFDAAVTLTIDGLSMYSFSENKNYEVVFIPAGQAGIIPGWHRTNDVSDSFQVAEYAKSAVATLLPSSKDFGTITVSFKAAWPKDAQPPADEPDPARNTRSADATARGNPIDAKYVEEIRNVGQFRGSVSVRYNKAIEPADLPNAKP
jgi:hypothetical protein